MGGVLEAFFGANTFAQMLTRLAFMLTITAVVGGIVAGLIKDTKEKTSIAKALAIAGTVGALVGLLAFKWYMATIPASAAELISIRIPSHLGDMMLASVLVAVFWFALTAFKPAVLHPWIASVMTVVILVFGLAPEEMVREIMRKPWVAGQYVYGNQIIGRDVPALGIKNELPIVAEKGILATHPFAPEKLRQVTEENKVDAGRFLA